MVAISQVTAEVNKSLVSTVLSNIDQPFYGLESILRYIVDIIKSPGILDSVTYIL